MTQPLPSVVLDALGDPNRRAIVQMLGRAPLSVREIADKLPISRPAVSRHLRVLKTAKLALDKPEGTRRIYSLETDGLETILEYLGGVRGDAATNFRLVVENLENR